MNHRATAFSVTAILAVIGGVTGPDAPRSVDDSLSDAGRRLLADSVVADEPTYELTADIETATGEVHGTVRADLPTSSDTLRFRWFAGVATDSPTVAVTAVEGSPPPADTVSVDASMITVTGVDAGSDGRAQVELTFSFTAPTVATDAPLTMPTGDGLRPAEIGLIGRGPSSVALGHWYPIWLPDGVSASPQLTGYGDIANYPAAAITAEIDAGGAVVTSGGIRLDGDEDDGAVIEGGRGLRDLAVVVFPGGQQRRLTSARGTSIVVTSPPGIAELEAVGRATADAVDALADALGDYPWRELDVQAVPLGSGVGGMEWPAMIWIEPTIFGGGVPGLGDLGGDLGALDDLDDLGDLGLGDEGGLGDLFGFDLDAMLLAVATTREWTIAHEVGHMWWHALVGNDSMAAPAVDEPLAQHSACLVMRATRPADADAVCAAQTSETFLQYTALMGVHDALADRASDQFDSSLQYGAVVYGKAPGFYRALERSYGVAETQAALANVVADHAFGTVTTDELRAELGDHLGDPAGVDAMWSRWMDEAHGEDDLGD